MHTRYPAALLPPNPAIPIRPAQPHDAAALHEGCWPTGSVAHCHDYLLRMEHLMQRRRGLCCVALGTDGRQIVGYGQLLLWRGSGEISDLIVAAAQRSRGTGTALIQHLVQAGRSLGVPAVEIGVQDSNRRARALYERLGFTLAHTRTPDDEPVHYLRLLLPLEP
ncbi:MAG: GNAT family N-acetyltransferase [Anaerolineae bacterium]|jgi:ribosomal protein S18 acetylase RimI-like enzyme|nr:GNAT family N-acetyltransferase [Anaerolineae bacterium]